MGERRRSRALAQRGAAVHPQPAARALQAALGALPPKGFAMDLGLKDCTAFVAGASKGLGKACAKALAGEGARVFICSRNAEELKQAGTDGGAAGFSAADVSRPAEGKRGVAAA